MLPSSHVYSSLLGYIALGTCTAISLPQMFSHWKRKKAEGISLTMLWLWLIGDLFGLAGTVVQGLLRTQIILGVINAIIDACIIWQCYYYNNFAQFRHILVAWRRVTSKTHPAIVDNRPSAVSPHDPNGSADADTITGGIVHRKDEENLSPDLSLRKTKTMSTLTPRSPTIHLPLVTEENRKKRLSIMYHIIYIVIVVGISILVWGVAVERVRKTATLKDGEDGTDPKFSSAGATFGWISMVIYTSSRYPQIYKNWRSKTCSGLSIWVFILLLIYNHTYIASIVIKSQTHSYLIVNMPWIVNSVYNILLDFFILGQFFMYRKNTKRIAEADQAVTTSAGPAP